MHYKVFDKERWDRMTEQEQIEETERCNDDPLYFYNNYFLPEGSKPCTQEEWDDIMVARDAMMNDAVILKGRRGNDLFLYPITPDESFKIELDGRDRIGFKFADSLIESPKVIYISKNNIP